MSYNRIWPALKYLQNKQMYMSLIFYLWNEGGATLPRITLLYFCFYYYSY